MLRSLCGPGLAAAVLSCLLLSWPLAAVAAEPPVAAEGPAAGPERGAEAIPALTTRYFALLSAGDYRLAYDFSGVGLLQQTSFETWADAERKALADEGATQDFKIRKITRDLNPDAAPWPGVYISVDYVALRSKGFVECGYVVWFAADDAGPFRFLRHQRTWLAKELIATLSDAELLKARQLAGCV